MWNIFKEKGCLNIKSSQKFLDDLHLRLSCLGINHKYDGASGNRSIEIDEKGLINFKLRMALKKEADLEQVKVALERLVDEDIIYAGKSYQFSINPKSEKKDVFVVIPSSLGKSKNYWESEQADQQFQKIAQTLSDYIVNTPYINKTDYNITDSQGYVVWRPNHDTSHAIRQYVFTRQLRELTLQKASPAYKDAAQNFTQEEVACIELAAFLYRSGRTNEQRWKNDYSNQTRSAFIFKNVAKRLGYNDNLIDHVSYLMTNRVSAHKDENGNFITNDAEYENDFRDETGLQKLGSPRKSYQGFSGSTAFEKLNKAKLTEKLLNTAHHADLQRCWKERQVEPDNRWKIQHGLKEDLDFLIGDEAVAEESATKLMQLAAKCARDTGVKVLEKGNPHVGYSYPEENNDELRARATKDVGKCISELEKKYTLATDKSSDKSDVEAISRDVNNVFSMINNTDAIVRLIRITDNEGNHTYDGLKFELGMTYNTISNRPLKQKKWLKDEHRKLYRDQRTAGLFFRELHEKAMPLNEQQARITSPDDQYYKASDSDKPVSVKRKGDDETLSISKKAKTVNLVRGSDKLTNFTKKVSFSLINNQGKTRFFRGCKGSEHFIGLGFLCDVNEVHRKGEKYIWSKDSGSNGKFWTGRNATLDNWSERKNVERWEVIRNKGVSLSQLKEIINVQQEFNYQNEMLFGYSKQSIKALTINDDTFSRRLKFLNDYNFMKQETQKLAVEQSERHKKLEDKISSESGKKFELPNELKDYTPIDVPLMIVDGNNKPHEYCLAQMSKDLELAFEIEKKAQAINSELFQHEVAEVARLKDLVKDLDYDKTSAKSFAQAVVNKLAPRNTKGQDFDSRVTAVLDKFNKTKPKPVVKTENPILTRFMAPGKGNAVKSDCNPVSNKLDKFAVSVPEAGTENSLPSVSVTYKNKIIGQPESLVLEMVLTSYLAASKLGCVPEICIDNGNPELVALAYAYAIILKSSGLPIEISGIEKVQPQLLGAAKSKIAKHFDLDNASDEIIAKKILNIYLNGNKENILSNDEVVNYLSKLGYTTQEVDTVKKQLKQNNGLYWCIYNSRFGAAKPAKETLTYMKDISSNAGNVNNLVSCIEEMTNASDKTAPAAPAA